MIEKKYNWAWTVVPQVADEDKVALAMWAFNSKDKMINMKVDSKSATIDYYYNGTMAETKNRVLW